MGTVIRPAAFARAPEPAPPAEPRRRSRIDGRFVSIMIALLALGWILALAGAAFTIRAVLLLFFATVAGRVRRVGLQRARF